MRKLIFGGIVFLLCSILPLCGAVILSDSFDYSNGTLVNVSGGTWVHHSGTVTGEMQVVSGRALVSQTNAEDVSATLAGGPYGASTNVLLYGAFTVNFAALPSGAGTYFAHFKDNGASNFRGKVFATTNGITTGFFRIGIGNVINANPFLLNSNLSLNTDYQVVVRYAPSNATTTLWLSPAAETDPGVNATDSATTISVSTFALRESFSNPDGMGTLFLDNLIVGTSFNDVVSNGTPAAPSINTQPQSQTVSEGMTVSFTVGASGDPPLMYQWQFNGGDVAGATDAALVLSGVTTNQAGAYTVVVTNGIGSVTSSPAILTVNSLTQPGAPALSYVTYNMKGNGATDWSTNSPQVQAIGHELMYLNADIITLNEIPNTFTYEMTNFIAAFLPGYYLATNSATDGFIRNGIASRFPILSSKSYLHSADLNPWGYTNSNFTRDLFEAQIAVPGFPQRLHVFVVHLKSGQDTDSSNKRSAEAAAVSNFLVTVFLATNVNSHSYVLSGDMNEDIDNPPSSNPQSIQKLVNPATGLQLTSPRNPVTGANLTFSIQSASGLTKRYDYIMPGALMFSNIAASQVFRTDLLTNPPAPLLTNDDQTASDHLPVQMVFANPYDQPFRITSISRSNQNLSLAWQSVPGQSYRVEASSNLATWAIFSTSAPASAYSLSLSTNVGDGVSFFRVSRLP